ncbi:cation diffusion facilitator family transporter [Starkeya koreensis]|uniref:Cation diffusion facilitator family transporter n=1 Tax=Ancylobacter koreensis TaxID=266121 RepID=A0ABT0DQ90_9HYPH|nr:cation diffusion facilitator family transporter [Ancylobacter koreensis]MCK0209435.1 cation diffusion facilitator family transporter [Ancylobacter koreensis]
MNASAEPASPPPDHASHDHAKHDHAPGAHARGGKGGHGAGDGHDHGISVTDDSQNRVFWVMIFTGGYMIAQATGGWLSGSLALIADAGHMLSDTIALFLSWMAFRLSRRPSDARRTFGYHRFQVLAALANGATLFLIAIWVVYEAIERFAQPVEVLGGPMLIVAVIGLLVNVGGVLVLRGGDRRNVNMRGALLHVVGDLLGSVAAISAALVILATGWMPIDPILSVFVSLLILRSAWSLIASSLNILMEGVPDELQGTAVSDELMTIPGVANVHHFHVWGLTGERLLASLHLVLAEGASAREVKAAVRARMAERFGIGHVTIETEGPDEHPEGMPPLFVTAGH